MPPIFLKVVQIECNTKRITFFIIAEMPPIFLKVLQIECPSRY